MPQFDVATFPSQLFWLILCFVALYLHTKYISTPSVESALNKRQKEIDDDEASAIRYDQEIEMYRKKLSLQIEEARALSKQQTAKTLLDTTSTAKKRKSEITKLINERLDASKQYIHDQKQQSDSAVPWIAAQTVQETLKKLLIQPVSLETIKAMIHNDNHKGNQQ